MTSSTDDFSHLPTADTAGRVDKRVLWQQHRRGKPASHEAALQPEHAEFTEPADAAPHEHVESLHSSWHELLHTEAPAAPAPEHEPHGEHHETECHADDGAHAEHHESEWLADDGAHAEQSAHQSPHSEAPPPPEVAEPAPADNTAEIRRSAKRALFVTIGLHVAVVLILALMHTAGIHVKPSEIVAIAGVDEQEAPAWKKVTTATPQAAPMPSISPMLATGVSDFAMPTVNFDSSAAQLNLGSSLGSFGTVGAAGAGGKISFLGNTANGRNIVYVVDLSSSMLTRSLIEGSDNSVSRFELLQKELRSSVGRLSSAVNYQILFFSDYAIPHDAVDTKDYSKLQEFEWSIRAGERDVKIPRFQYLQGSRANVTRSQKIIEECATMGGTNWGSGLRMALNGNPKPDVIFFMTDGDAGDEQGWADDVTANNSRGKRTIIHTTAMMVPGAADALNEIAKRNGGTFTIVMPTGKVMTAEQFFKQRGR